MYDVFLASAVDDVDAAEKVARRLRALKMKVAFDKKRTERPNQSTFVAKDAKAAETSKCVLVLWSASAAKSDWVHAAARAGRAEGHLVQATLDDTRPAAPFNQDHHFKIAGLTPQTKPKGWLDLVGALGDAQARPDLRAWAAFGPRDKSKREAWQAAHPSDPLTVKTASAGVAQSRPWAGPWRVEDAQGLPFGVEDSLGLLSGVNEASAIKLKGAGLASLRQLAIATREQAEIYEGRAGLRIGFIEQNDLVNQARELLNGHEPRARADLDTWRVMQLDAYKAHYPDPLQKQNGHPVGTHSGFDDLMERVGMLPPIGFAIVIMLLLGWVFGQDERARDAEIALTPPISASR